jgi:hypothetical protein
MSSENTIRSPENIENMLAQYIINIIYGDVIYNQNEHVENEWLQIGPFND